MVSQGAQFEAARRELEEEVLAFALAQGPQGVTESEVGAGVGLPAAMATARISALVRRGQLVDSAISDPTRVGVIWVLPEFAPKPVFCPRAETQAEPTQQCVAEPLRHLLALIEKQGPVAEGRYTLVAAHGPRVRTIPVRAADLEALRVHLMAFPR